MLRHPHGAEASFSPKHLLTLILVLAHTRKHVEANPINAAEDDLLIGLATNVPASQRVAVAHEQQMSTRMEQIMSDRYEDDFALSINLLNLFTTSLEDFVRDEQLVAAVSQAHPQPISAWATTKGIARGTIVKELDQIVATYWTRFKPLIETIIAQRPPNLGPNDLDFRCTKRLPELGDMMALGAQSSLYSIYLDTFYSELFVHCLFRKLALIRNNKIVPTPLLKQFVDIYLELPAVDPIRPDSGHSKEMAIKQLLAGRGFSFNMNTALARVGPLSSAAELVVDPRTFLSSKPDAKQVDQLVREFERDCQTHVSQLVAIWGDFDDFIRAISTDTTNLEDVNTRIKFLAPQLVYGTICGQLLQMPH